MTHEHVLSWLRADAPYAPFVQLGLLACLRGIDDGATVHWRPDQTGFAYECVLSTRCTLDEVAASVADAPWPDLAGLEWPAGFGQAIKPALSELPPPMTPASAWRTLAGVPASALDRPIDAHAAARRHVAALLTDGVRDNDGGLGRSRLLRGVKADLSGVKATKVTAGAICGELAGGPAWSSSGAGSGLGLVPEVQTFGGVTGPKPDAVNASSLLLYVLIVHALGTLPPFGVLRGGRRVVGGLLAGADGTLTWPIHTSSRALRALLAAYGSAALGGESDGPTPHRGVAAVYRSRPRAINSMISMFPWGELVV